MKLRRVFSLLGVMTLGLSGCNRSVPNATVVLVDPSASVIPQARREELAAIAALIPKMDRGDSLIVIPIADNEASDIQGRVLRLQAPVRRETYDTDLRRFQTDAGRKYAAFATNLLAHPGKRTDILGALNVARQEFEAIPAQDTRRLIVLSDFLEDDARYRFTADVNLSRQASARRLADRLVREDHFSLPGVQVHLGGLESCEFVRLSQDRQQAVRAFWTEYFARAGDPAEIQLDGTGMLDVGGSN